MSEPICDEEAVFNAARRIIDPQARHEYLAEACSDETLRARVQALLDVHEREKKFLESPAARWVETAESDAMSERPGTVIGRYKLLEQIGEGGFGVVFMAEQTQPVRRKVAFKVLKAGMDTRQVIARFEAERQALALMDHPNIARVLDGGATDTGRPYFVMELVNGIPITEYCDRNQLAPKERLELFVHVCQAVQHAHQKGIIHRDLKPGNVLVTLHDGVAVPKVIDFGIAKATGQQLTEKTLFTNFQQMIGTPLYMSPEQAEMSGLDVDTRADIYSLGVLLYELLTGTTPFDRDRLKQAAFDEIRRIIREEEPPRPSTRLSTMGASATTISAQRRSDPKRLSQLIRGELDWIVMKALEKDRNRRYETANGLAADVRRYLSDEPVTAGPASAGYRFRKFARRNKRSLISAAGLGVALLVAVGAVAGSIGWVVRDRTTRRLLVEQTVKTALEEVDGWLDQGKSPEALVAARRAQAALAGGDAAPETVERVRQVVADLELVHRLEEIKMGSHGLSGLWRDWAAADRAYTAAFDACLGSVPIAEAAGWIRSRGKIAVPLAAALDDWAHCREMENRADAATIRAVAVEADTDPWRRRLREAIARRDTDALVKLADSEDLLRQGPSTFILLTEGLEDQPERVYQVMQAAQQIHPGDFWVNLQTAHACMMLRKPLLDLAVSFNRAAVAIRPTSASALNNLGAALQRTRRRDDAIACYRRSLELSPRGAVTLANLGLCLAEQGQHEEAIALCREAVQLAPEAATVHASLGVALDRAGRFQEAIPCFRETIRLDDNHNHAYCSLGHVLRKAGKTDEAIACCRKATELDPECPLGHVNLGAAYAAKEQFDEAVACLRKAVEVGPHESVTHSNLGSVLLQIGQLDEALACYRKAIELDPNEPQCHLGLGAALAEKGQLSESVKYLRSGLKLDPKDADGYDNLGNVLSRLGQTDEAIPCYRKAIQLDPKMAFAQNNLAAALIDRDQMDEALSCCQKAIELAPQLAPAHFNLGRVRAKQGKLHESMAAFRRSFELEPSRFDPYTMDFFRQAMGANPTNALAHYNLGHGFALQEQWKEAAEAYRRALSVNPNDALAQRELGAALLAQGDLDRAVEELRRALVLEPKNVRTRRELAQALARKGDFRAAAQEYLKVLDLDPADHWDFYMAGSLLAYLGDAGGHGRLSRRIVERFDRSADLKVCERMSRACLLLPGAVPFEIPLQLADRGLGMDSEDPWLNLSKSIADYRAGRFEAAAGRLRQYGDRIPERWATPTPGFFLAIACHQLGRGDEAKAAFSASMARMDRELPPAGKVDFGVNFHEWLMCHVARREAEALLAQPAPTATSTAPAAE